MLDDQICLIHTSQISGSQVRVTEKAIRPLFADQATYSMLLPQYSHINHYIQPPSFLLPCLPSTHVLCIHINPITCIHVYLL